MKLVQVSENFSLFLSDQIARRKRRRFDASYSRKSSVVCYGSGGAVYAALLLQLANALSGDVELFPTSSVCALSVVET
jgi:hypothetical protein